MPLASTVSQSELEVHDNLLVHPDNPGDTDPAVAHSPTRARIVETLVEHEALAFSAMSENDAGDVWSAVGLARGDGWELLAVWTFADETLADEGEDRFAKRWPTAARYLTWCRATRSNDSNGTARRCRCEPR
jgi:hypothetical protein